MKATRIKAAGMIDGLLITFTPLVKVNPVYHNLIVCQYPMGKYISIVSMFPIEKPNGVTLCPVRQL
jgi:hypothetical protein